MLASNLVGPGLGFMHACTIHACHVLITGQNHLLPFIAVCHLPTELRDPQGCMPPGLQTYGRSRILKEVPQLGWQVTSHVLAIYIRLTGCLLGSTCCF